MSLEIETQAEIHTYMKKCTINSQQKFTYVTNTWNRIQYV